MQGHYAIAQEEGLKLARLSGDYNPLHTDPTFARRLQFGGTVVHGVHNMLRALDEAVSRLSLAESASLVSLQAQFPNPVKFGDTVHYELEHLPAENRVKVVAEANGKRTLTLDIVLGGPEAAEPADVATIDGPAAVEGPVDQGFPLKLDEGDCALYCDRAIASELFPSLLTFLSPSLLAQLCACTRIVGMKCPGLHSIFSGLSLVRHAAREAAPESLLNFRVTSANERFRHIVIAVSGPEIEGTLETFLRPPPAEQPSYAEVAGTVAAQAFAGQRALVVGGSRGVGEVTAKILAAGGAQVTITYFRGEAEAKRVCDDILSGGGHCAIARFDVVSATARSVAEQFAAFSPTHLYYFATPKIESHKLDSWNRELFELYSSYYLAALRSLVDGLCQEQPEREIGLLFPSSIYVEKPEPGFAEYAVAKAAGEALCAQLARRYGNLRPYSPRLPQMVTDQTASLFPTKARPVLTIMLDVLNRFAAKA